jgi:hypothetical protein
MGAVPPTSDQLLRGDFRTVPVIDTSPAAPSGIVPVDVPPSKQGEGGQP